MNRSAHVRPAEPEDYDRIIAVVDEWWERPMRSVLPRLFLDHFHRTSLVAEDCDGLAGFLVGLMSPSVPDAAYIHFVGVAPRARKEGLARGLYQRFFDMAAVEHRTEVRAITSPQNERSLAFHTAMGFTVTGPVHDHDGPGVDRMVFRLRLLAHQS
ncbi:GNAT family N-acetyltransferase [Streptomyces sp. Ag109_G2-15]|uniref:GNAT family N-acetyltransferase n=1 Tax=Streptomyces sp. Ag109_G2-15 TaxID=1938850 RepID=UPI000BD662D6|nr:GNAT family N-acetyltransferase [Streptomyces sp. Ag109_G2-15]SOE06947.1 Predicted acetyltransferase, GNAT superfamily [Streptomyces sp. Ag109_G2-15]